MKEIPLQGGLVALVDDEDFSKLSGFGWRAIKRKDRNTVYVSAEVTLNGRKVIIHMHRVILDAQPTVLVDHANGDGLDNRKSNIRLCSIQENARNLRVIRNVHGYKGVTYKPVKRIKGTFTRLTKPWLARITVDGKKLDCGAFSTAEEAAFAYDRAAIRRFGAFAATNQSLGALR